MNLRDAPIYFLKTKLSLGLNEALYKVMNHNLTAAPHCSKLITACKAAEAVYMMG